uniref:pyridoxamine 5'-phosphate oxidase family protein n=1 Tax=Nocardiopsis mwathae TaxID=1472723 RepID=UPI0031B5FEBA
MIRRVDRPIASQRLAELARELLDASRLCAISTVSPQDRAHINTAYFAWTPEFDLVWLSDPRARHSGNVRMRSTVAVAVYDSHQAWGQSDCGL